VKHDRCSDQCACWKAGFRAAEREILAVHEHCTEHNRRCLCYDRGRHSVKRPFVNLSHLPPPFDPEAEQAVIGAMIDAPHAAIPLLEGKLVPDDFTYESYRYLFEKALLAWNRGLMEERGPKRMRIVLLTALILNFRENYYTGPTYSLNPPYKQFPNYIKSCRKRLDACAIPFTTEEEEHGAGCSLDDWFGLVETYTAYYRDRLLHFTFRRALLQESPAILRPLLVDEDPRRTLAAIFSRLRLAAHRARRPPQPKKQTPHLVDTVIATRRKERDARLKGL